MFDQGFDPRTGEARAYSAGEAHFDPRERLCVKAAHPGAAERVKAAWAWAACLTLTVSYLVAATPVASQGGEIIVALLVGAGYLAAGGVPAAILSTLINVALLTAVSFGLQALNKPKGRGQIGGGDALRGIYRDTAAPAVIAFGENVLSGLLIEARSVNEDGEAVKGGTVMHIGLAICQGPIEAVDAITLNDQPHTAAQYRNNALFIEQLGFADQPPLQGPFRLGPRTINLPEKWKEKDRRLSGVAYLWGILRHSVVVFPTNVPNIRCRIRGRLVWDPRDTTQNATDETTWRYSNNAVLVILHYLMNKLYGRGVPLALIDIENFKAEADKCDDTLTVTVRREVTADQPEESEETIEVPKYRFDGWFLSDSRPDDILGSMADTIAGTVTPYQGKWTVRVGAPLTVETWPNDTVIPAALRGQNVKLDESHIRADGDFEIVPAPRGRDRVNTIVALFQNPEKDYQQDTSPPVTRAEYVSEDGGDVLKREISLPFVANVHRARYIIQQILLKNRLGQRISWPGRPSTLVLPLAGRIEVDNELFGLSAQDFVIDEVDIDPIRRTMDMLLSQYSDSIYANLDEVVVLPPRTTLPEYDRVDPPQRVTVSESLRVNPDGTRSARLVVNITPPEDSLYDGFRVEWRKTTEVFNTQRIGLVPQSRRQYEILDLEEGAYDIRVYTVLGTLSSTAFLAGGRVTWKTSAPPAPTSLTVVFDPKTAAWEYTVRTPNLAPDIKDFELRILDDTGSLGVDLEGEWAQASLLGHAQVLDRGGLQVSGVLRSARPSFLKLKDADDADSRVVYAKTRDATDFYSAGTSFARLTVPEAASDALFHKQYAEDGWSAGQIVDGIVGDDGCLTTAATALFSTAEGKGGSSLWATGYHQLVFVGEIIDLIEDKVMRFDFDVQVSEGTLYRIEIRTRGNQEEEWGPYRAPRGRLGRYVEFRLIAWNLTGRAKVSSVSLVIRDSVDTEYVDSFDMAAITGSRSESIVDDSRADWILGNQMGTDVGGGGLQLDEDSVIKANGSTTITAPHSPDLYLNNNSWTIEFELSFASDPGSQVDVVVLGKGTDWELVWNPTAMGLRYFVFRSTGFTGDDPKNYFFGVLVGSDNDPSRVMHIALTYDAGTLRGYVDGKASPTGTGSLSFTLPTSASAITLLQGLDGEAKNIRVWNYPRSQVQISGFRGAKVDPKTPGLLRQWRCSDGAGTTLTDFSPAAGHATITNGAWGRKGYREMVPVPLWLVRNLTGVHVSYDSIEPASTSVVVQCRITGNDGSYPVAIGNWATVDPSNGYRYEFNTTGHRLLYLEVRQHLISDDVAATPVLTALAVVLDHNVVSGTATVMAPKDIRFSRIDRAEVVAIEGAEAGTASGPPIQLIRSIYGTRFAFTDTAGLPINPTIDVLFQGSRIRGV